MAGQLCTAVVLSLFYLVHPKTIINPGQFEGTLKYGCEESSKSMECRFNPDEYLDVPQIIKRHGYPSEAHIIRTDDGYLLEIHRIPGPKNGKQDGQPVFLQHGFLASSADWILNENQSLAYTLADEGYDVWLGNTRGNVYSRAHEWLSPLSAKFWNFSWHEMATKDLPAILYHISNTTGKPGEIIFVGHSMGTTMSYVLCSTLPQVAKNLRLIISLAPIAYMTHTRATIRYIAPFVNDISWVAKHLGLNMFLPSNKILHLLASKCLQTNVTRNLCEKVLAIIGDWGDSELNFDILPLIFSHDPAGASTKTVLHYLMEIRNEGKFQQYDYGPHGNILEYGTPTPPDYNLNNIKRPFYLMFAENDRIASPIDVLRLSKQLTNLVGVYKIPDDKFGHPDFVFGNNCGQLVNRQILAIIRNFTETDNNATSNK